MDAQWDDMLRLLGSRRPALLDRIAAEVQANGGESKRAAASIMRSASELFGGRRRHAAVAGARLHPQELARIMGVEPVGLEIDQPLSTFGLDSLLALELKNNLEGRLDFTLPMAKLMEGPSIASLAEATVRIILGERKARGQRMRLIARSCSTSSQAEASSSAEEWEPLLALRPEGSRPPLVLLPALGGDSRYYAELVQSLGDDQPVYAFRPRGIDQDLPPHQVDGRNDRRLRGGASQACSRAGPYYLAGWSTGGIFAFALAEALESVGEEVALVALFDTPLALDLRRRRCRR